MRFRFRAGTSRGVLTEKKIWVIKIWHSENPEVFGLGEVAPLSGLSIDDGINYDEVLEDVKEDVGQAVLPESEDKCLTLAANLCPEGLPALHFALEMALVDLWKGGRRLLFSSAFTAGKEEIPINGLIWMGEEAFMREQARKKLQDGFTCIKMKIGAIGFEQELKILDLLRDEGVEILRVDANGAFSPGEALEKLQKLSGYQLHSIEQPIASGQWEQMAELCRAAPVPIALDEELIGVTGDDRGKLLDAIGPRFIILKPTLLGGIAATRSWIREAVDRDIGWWITSALESNIGLNAIAQMTAILNYTGHQGLGTGQLFENNFDSPMKVRNGHLYFDPAGKWDFKDLDYAH